MRQDIAELLSNAQRDATTIDAWTVCAFVLYVMVMAHYIDKKWISQNHVLFTLGMYIDKDLTIPMLYRFLLISLFFFNDSIIDSQIS